MYEEYCREIGVYGKEWEKIHGGYFSDLTVAACLIRKVDEAIEALRPQVIVDLGGGTGFLLEELMKKRSQTDLRMVAVDVSNTQLCGIRNPAISRVLCSIDRVRREDLDEESRRFLFIVRSVLHYFGKDGLPQVLKHLRSQMRKGEIFVHQTACFESHDAARCLNTIYQEMRTGKWYPTVQELSSLLENAGWQITAIAPAPKLPLTSEELSLRYGLSRSEAARICRVTLEEYGEMDDVFCARQDGFCAYLHYRIFTCVAR